MYTIQPFEATEENYAIVIDIWNATHPENPGTIELIKYVDEHRNPEDTFQRDLILCDNKVVAYGAYGQGEALLKEKKFFLRINVHPDHEHPQEIRHHYFKHVVEQLKSAVAEKIITNVREDCDEDLQFIKSLGFAPLMRYPISHLNVENFDFAAFEERVQKTLNSGIEIITAEQIKAEFPEDWIQRLYKLDVEIMRDVPSPIEFVEPPMEDYINFFINHPQVMLEAYFVAREGDQLVGESHLRRKAGQPDMLHTGLTGVLRSHRRRGIALALKIEAIKFAKQYGTKVIDTDNEENNPMYQINVQLGYEPQPAHLEFEKTIV